MSVEPVWEDQTVYVYRAGDARERKGPPLSIQVTVSSRPLLVEEERRRMLLEEKQRFLTLKGQMIYMEEWESICFLGIPV